MRSITIANRDFALRFRITTRDEVERFLRSECQIQSMWDGMLSGSLRAMACVVLGGIRHEAENKARKMTVDEMIDLLDRHCEEGGELDPLMRQVYSEVFESGVIGKKADPKRVMKLLGLADEDEEKKPAGEEGPVVPQ